MTIRKRIKNKWHSQLGDFLFKRATYHPTGERSFEVWYKHDFIGDCFLGNSYWIKTIDPFPESISSNYKEEDLRVARIDMRLEANKEFISGHVGRLIYTGLRNQFPEKILYVELHDNILKLKNSIVTKTVFVEKLKKKLVPKEDEF